MNHWVHKSELAPDKLKSAAVKLSDRSDLGVSVPTFAARSERLFSNEINVPFRPFRPFHTFRGVEFA